MVLIDRARPKGVDALQSIDASTIRSWAASACEAMGSAAAEIDALNVYPVPDGDTGTNLHLTLRSGLDAVVRDDHQADLQLTLDRLARGALLGARGNSGVIVSQFLRGLAECLGTSGSADGPNLAVALTHAADLAYAAVADPVEGTILTVARAAAEAANHAVVRGPASATKVARAAATGAAAALLRTPSQLAVLADAGVVDAGGRGLCVLLDSLAATLAGERVVPGPAVRVGGQPDAHPLEAARESGSVEFGYEVQFLLEQATEATVEAMRAELAALGDSLVIVGGRATTAVPGLWNVHVHVNDVGAAVEAGVRAGRPHSISITRFADQMGLDRSALDTASVHPTWSGRGLVAVAPGPGLAALFAGEGVEVVDDSPARAPTSGEVLDAIRRTGAAEVVVLPNHATMTTIADAAAQQARAGGQDVAVVPTKSFVQGLAAVAVADPSRRFADDVIALAEAAAATRWAEIAVAGGEAMTMAGRCAAGDVLGLAEGDVVLIGADQVQVACDLLDRLLSAGGELVTLVLGADAADGLAGRVREHLRRTHHGVDVMDYRGDQPDQPVLIGVE